MSEFMESLNSLKPFLSIDMDLAELSGSAMENASLGFMNLFNESFTMPFDDNLQNFYPLEPPKLSFESNTEKKRKVVVAEASSTNSSRREEKTKRRKESTGWNGGRGSSFSNERERRPMEVVHVRARRGQATDSHSLAERVRRERINERMRCLQDLVPGCYKTMGMASVLDEIINYVQSLQNQVEFLSMKLSAASDFNLDIEAIASSQKVESAHNVASDVDILTRAGYGVYKIPF